MISRNLPCWPDCCYLAGLIAVTQYLAATSDPHAAGLAEAHAEVILQALTTATGSAYTGFLNFAAKACQVYQAAPNSA